MIGAISEAYYGVSDDKVMELLDETLKGHYFAFQNRFVATQKHPKSLRKCADNK